MADGLTGQALVMGDISNHSDNILSHVFARSSEFSLLSGINIHVLNDCLINEFEEDGDGDVFKKFVLGEYP